MVNELDVQIGKAWALHRDGDQAAAIREFEQALRIDPDNVDAHYGLGLSQRANGLRDAAEDSFQHALGLAKRKLDSLRKADNENDLKSTEDDRYMMLVRMLSQRLEETKHKK